MTRTTYLQGTGGGWKDRSPFLVGFFHLVGSLVLQMGFLGSFGVFLGFLGYLFMLFR